MKKKVIKKVTKKKVNQKNKKKKGFTLVELLAVIVVLAIIMIIAIPSVLKSMNNAKKGAFKIECQKVLNTAQSAFQSDEMLGQKDDYLLPFSCNSEINGKEIKENEAKMTKTSNKNDNHPFKNLVIKKMLNVKISDNLISEDFGYDIYDLDSAYCYTLDDLGISTSGKYYGFVLVELDDNDTAHYYLNLTDSGFSVTDTIYKNLEKRIKSKKNSQIKTECPNCYEEYFSLINEKDNLK